MSTIFLAHRAIGTIRRARKENFFDDAGTVSPRWVLEVVSSIENEPGSSCGKFIECYNFSTGEFFLTCIAERVFSAQRRKDEDLTECDVCQKMAPNVTRCIVSGIETFACEGCRS